MNSNLRTGGNLDREHAFPGASVARALEALAQNPAPGEATTPDPAPVLADRNKHLANILARRTELETDMGALARVVHAAQEDRDAALKMLERAGTRYRAAWADLVANGMRIEMQIRESQAALETSAHPAIASFIAVLKDVHGQLSAINPGHAEAGSANVLALKRDPAPAGGAILQAALDRVQRAQEQAQAMLHDDGIDVIRRLRLIRDDVAEAARGLF